jgi:hypothetical protein
MWLYSCVCEWDLLCKLLYTKMSKTYDSASYRRKNLLSIESGKRDNDTILRASLRNASYLGVRRIAQASVTLLAYVRSIEYSCIVPTL